MECSRCGCNKFKVLDKRNNKNGSIRRRRECVECGSRISTIEHMI